MQASDRLRAGNRYRLDPLGPVFTGELGERLTPKAATNALARLANTAKVSTTTLHANASYSRAQPHRGRRRRYDDVEHLGPHQPKRHALALLARRRRRGACCGGRACRTPHEIRCGTLGVDGNRERFFQRMATAMKTTMKKARRNGLSMVAGTGFEPVTFGL